MSSFCEQKPCQGVLQAEQNGNETIKAKSNGNVN
jgi:hypothetical protein